MKNWMLGLSIFAVLLCGFRLLEKDRQVAGIRFRAELAERQLHEASAQAAQRDKKSRDLQEQLRETRSMAQKSLAPYSLPQTAAVSASSNRSNANPLFRDPKIRKAMEAEAREGIEKNIKSLFKAGLAEKLHLDEPQSAALFQLLTDKRALFWDKMLLPMMTGDIAEADMSAAGETIKSAFEQNKTQIRALLGDDGFATYEWFEKTEGARDEYKDAGAKFTKAGQQLNEQQAQQLSDILLDEHANFKMRYNFEDPSQLNLDHWYSNFTEEKLEACGQDMEALNDRVLQRAQAVLSPAQLDIFREMLAERSLKARFVVMTTTAMLARQR